MTAMEGSILSSTRILLAAVLGPVLAADPPLSLSGWAGALLIFGANAALGARKAGEGLGNPGVALKPSPPAAKRPKGKVE